MSIGWRTVVLGCGLIASAASAGEILDRVKHDGILRCGAAERPGYASIEDGRPTGRAADLCRQVAERVLGPGGRYALRLLDLDSDFDRVRRGEIELALLGPRTLAEQRLSETLAAAGEAYSDRFSVLLPQAAAAHALSDLRGQSICFVIGDPVWPLLSRDLEIRHVSFRPFGFSEAVEMKDAYNVGRCDAVAGLASDLDELRQDRGVKGLRSRLLDEDLGVDRVFAMVPVGEPELLAIAAQSLSKEQPPR